MERLGVIEPAREPIDWVSSMVTVTKLNGTLRVCIDPCDLNRAIKREYFPMPTVEEIAACIPGHGCQLVLCPRRQHWLLAGTT